MAEKLKIVKLKANVYIEIDTYIYVKKAMFNDENSCIYIFLLFMR